MAKATIIADVKVTLILNGEEATLLQQILQHIGGCPIYSARKHIDNILEVLKALNIPIIPEYQNFSINGNININKEIEE